MVLFLGCSKAEPQAENLYPMEPTILLNGLCAAFQKMCASQPFAPAANTCGFSAPPLCPLTQQQSELCKIEDRL